MPTTSTPTTHTDHEPAAFAWTNLWFLVAAHLTAAFAIDTNDITSSAGANGSINVYSFRQTHIVLDLSGYFGR